MKWRYVYLFALLFAFFPMIWGLSIISLADWAGCSRLGVESQPCKIVGIDFQGIVSHAVTSVYATRITAPLGLGFLFFSLFIHVGLLIKQKLRPDDDQY